MPSAEPVPPTMTSARQVDVARAGIENLRVDDLAGELAGGPVDLLVVDVRSAQEWSTERIPGSINVPRGTIETTIAGVAGPTRRIVVYCDTGARSALAAATLYALGYQDVAQLDGGLDAWRAAGRPLATTVAGGSRNPRIARSAPR